MSNWKLVPLEPTQEMADAAWKYGNEATSDAPDPVYAYKAALAAAPTPPAQETQWQQAVLNECMSIEGCYKESDPIKTVRCLIDWHVENERDSTAAQEDEPVGFVGQSMIDGLKAGKRVQNWILPKKNDDPDFCEMNVPLYTRPDNSGLRKAAEKAFDLLDEFRLGPEQYAVLMDLRAALEGK